MCLDLFTRAATAMAAVGLILADTKFELGFVDGVLVVCDEVIDARLLSNLARRRSPLR